MEGERERKIEGEKEGEKEMTKERERVDIALICIT